VPKVSPKNVSVRFDLSRWQARSQVVRIDEPRGVAISSRRLAGPADGPSFGNQLFAGYRCRRDRHRGLNRFAARRHYWPLPSAGSQQTAGLRRGVLRLMVREGVKGSAGIRRVVQDGTRRCTNSTQVAANLREICVGNESCRRLGR